MGCLLWVQPLIDNLPQFLQWCVQYHFILYRVIMALDCIYEFANWFIICSGNCLLPVWHKAITWSKAELLLVRFSETSVTFESKGTFFLKRNAFIWKCFWWNMSHFVHALMCWISEKSSPDKLQLHVLDLTHCGLVTPYGDRDLGQHWLR